jgi:ribonuclease HI
MIQEPLKIYTDGSSYSKPRMGGVGIRFVGVDEMGDEVIDDVELPGFKGATNNQMELYACVAGLREALEYRDLSLVNAIEIYTDSLYVADNYKSAMFEWPRNRWRNRDGRPILNAELWKDLVKLIKKSLPRRVDIQWIKGHAKDKHNKAVDKLAKKSAKNPLNPPLTIVGVRRKKTKKTTELGSVEMRGQRISMRIITTEYLPVQRLFKYKYEVISKGSKYYGNVDVIFCSEVMREGHHYEVSVNKNTANPTVTKVLREVER